MSVDAKHDPSHGKLKCYLPFLHLTVVETNNVYPCICPSWLKADGVVGNTKEQRLPEIWNGEAYQRIRALFLEGRYGELCREEICPYLRGEQNATPPDDEVLAAVQAGHTVLDYGIKRLQHDVDKGCNLNCTMCREEKIAPDADNVARALRDVADAADMGSLKAVAWSGAGEVLAMAPVVREMQGDRFSAGGIGLAITTNLTFFNEEMWSRLSHNRVRLTVSVDGCSREVYEPIRVGARWDTVLANLRMVAELRRSGRLVSLVWNYTVMRQNVSDVARAIALAEELGLDRILINAQLGSLSRTGGNMFEDLDLDALDALYEQLERADAFAKRFVLVSTTGMRDRRYRTLAYRVEMAEHIDGRRFQMKADTLQLIFLHSHALRVLQQTITDVNTGRTDISEALPPASMAFLRHIADPLRTDWIARWLEALAQGLFGLNTESARATMERERETVTQVAALLERLERRQADPQRLAS